MFSNAARRGGRCARQTAHRFASTSADQSTSSATSTAFKYFRTFSAAASIAATAYTAGSLYPPTLATYISPRPAPPLPHPDDPTSIAYLTGLEDELQNLPALNKLRAREDASEWYEARPYQNLSEDRRRNSLTAGALRGPGKLALAPLVRSRKDHKESWYFVHVGRALCGHEGIVHGGLLATILDEMLGRIALLNLPEKIGVTAYLNVKYRAPTRADQFLIVKTYLVEVEGRKSKVGGVVEDLDGNVLVEADALFVQPRYAKLLNTKQMRDIIGEPVESSGLVTPGTSVTSGTVALPDEAASLGGLKA